MKPARAFCKNNLQCTEGSNFTGPTRLTVFFLVAPVYFIYISISHHLNFTKLFSF